MHGFPANCWKVVPVSKVVGKVQFNIGKKTCFVEEDDINLKFLGKRFKFDKFIFVCWSSKIEF